MGLDHFRYDGSSWPFVVYAVCFVIAIIMAATMTSTFEHGLYLDRSIARMVLLFFALRGIYAYTIHERNKHWIPYLPAMLLFAPAWNLFVEQR